MKAARAQYRPSIRNTQTVKRRPAKPTRLRATLVKPVSPKSRTLRRQTAARRRTRPVVTVQPQGLSVFGLLTLATAGLALLFVLALNWQRQTYQLNQKEVALRSKLDQTANERRQLVAEQRHALSPRENDLRGRQGRLSPLKLEARTASAKSYDNPLSFGGKPKPSAPARQTEPPPTNSDLTASPVIRQSH
jgi:hypothetical protein